MILCDTNIIIEFYKGNSVYVEELKAIGQPNIAVSVITTGELIYGALNKREMNQILKSLSLLNVLEIDSSICQTFLQLMEQYSLSHNLTLPDAIIAATAIKNDIPLFTLNQKDFRYINDLKFYQ